MTKKGAGQAFIDPAAGYKYDAAARFVGSKQAFSASRRDCVLFQVWRNDGRGRDVLPKLRTSIRSYRCACAFAIDELADRRTARGVCGVLAAVFGPSHRQRGDGFGR